MSNADRAQMTAESWMALAALYELAAMGLLLPTRDLAEALSSGEYAEACGEAFDELGVARPTSLGRLSAYDGADAGSLFHELRHEYTMLFSKAPEPLITPYVGVWAEREQGGKGLLFVGAKSMDIERFMRRYGVVKDVSAGQSNDPVDHIGTMCEFMKYLCLVEARAVVPVEGADVRKGDLAEFHEKHFRGYAAWCAGQICEIKPSAYYALVADVLEQVARHF